MLLTLIYQMNELSFTNDLALFAKVWFQKAMKL